MALTDDTDSMVDACPYRSEFEHPARSLRRCQFISDTLNTRDVELTGVSHEACRVCVQCEFPTSERWNRVVAGFIRFGTQKLLERFEASSKQTDTLHELQSFAISELVRTTLNAPPATQLSRIDWLARTQDRRCDVLIDSRLEVARPNHDLWIRSVQSILGQTDVESRAILVLPVTNEPVLLSQLPPMLRNHPRLALERAPVHRSLLAVALDLAPSLQAPFVALHALDSISRPTRLRTALQALLSHGGEVAAASVRTPHGPRIPGRTSPDDTSEIPWRSLVCRRSSLLDFRHELNTSHATSTSQEFDRLLARFVEHRQLIVKGPIAVDQIHTSSHPQPSTPGSALSCTVERHPPTKVDVVLPFFNTPEFVNQSLASILAQQNTEVVVHLIDDASTCSFTVDIDHWLRDPRVRLYRNSRNVGPYISFNNVSHFFETDFVAVQDADDLSLPHRLAHGTASLTTSQHDIFAGGIELFGELVDGGQVRSSSGASRRRKFWSSRYPSDERPQSIINGTVVMRTDTFRQLGGFTDYGDIASCRCGLDTEFYSRAYYAGHRFHISQSIVLKCRRHRDSMTQNRDTGWGTARRHRARERLLERLEVYRQDDFQAGQFGGRDRYRELTVRIAGGD